MSLTNKAIPGIFPISMYHQTITRIDAFQDSFRLGCNANYSGDLRLIIVAVHEYLVTGYFNRESKAIADTFRFRYMCNTNIAVQRKYI